MRPKVRCSVCGELTDLSRGVSAYACPSGVFVRVSCTNCSADIIVKTRSSDNKETAQVVRRMPCDEA